MSETVHKPKIVTALKQLIYQKSVQIDVKIYNQNYQESDILLELWPYPAFSKIKIDYESFKL